jgi:hypothetical protein
MCQLAVALSPGLFHYRIIGVSDPAGVLLHRVIGLHREEVLHLAEQPLLVIRGEGVKPRSQGTSAASILGCHGVVLGSVAGGVAWRSPSCSTISMASATMALASAAALGAAVEARRLNTNPSQ